MASSNLLIVILEAVFALGTLVGLVLALGSYAAYRAQLQQAIADGRDRPKPPVGWIIAAATSGIMAGILAIAPLSTVAIKVDLPPPAADAQN